MKIITKGGRVSQYRSRYATTASLSGTVLEFTDEGPRVFWDNGEVSVQPGHLLVPVA